jgi:predicted site-specific integrase-resolvase
VRPRTIILTEGQQAPAASAPSHLAIDARVSSAERKDNLDRQAERLAASCAARGSQVAQMVNVNEVGSGINDGRPHLLALLADQSIGVIVVE